MEPAIEPDDLADIEADIEAVQAQQRAEEYQSMRERGRQIGGLPGAVMAGVMVALREIYEAPKRDDGAVTVESSSEPFDVDREGIHLAAELDGDAAVSIDALEPRAPVVGRRRPRRRR